MENLSTVYENVRKYASETDTHLYDMKLSEVQAIVTCSPDVWEIVCLAFDFGFAKGCRKTKKMIK